MGNINLATEIEERDQKPELVSKSLGVAILMLVLALLVWGGLVFGKKNLEGRINSVKAQYDSEYEKFLTGNAKEVADFENRSGIASALLEEKINAGSFLAEIEKSMVTGAYLDSLKYEAESGTLTLVGAANDYNVVAKQILSFKQNSMFSSVVPKETGMEAGENDGQTKIIFNLELKLNSLNK